MICDLTPNQWYMVATVLDFKYLSSGPDSQAKLKKYYDEFIDCIRPTRLQLKLSNISVTHILQDDCVNLIFEALHEFRSREYQDKFSDFQNKRCKDIEDRLVHSKSLYQ